MENNKNQETGEKRKGKRQLSTFNFQLSILKNRWVKFAIASILYLLLFVVWTGNWWFLLGLPVIYDIYVSKLFYKYVWHHNTYLCRKSGAYKTLYEWVSAIVFATVVASIAHLYLFQMYVIPSSSMEKTLLVGDYLYVSKATYGPKMPNTPIAFPFVHHTMPFSTTKKSFSESVQWPYHRLKGITNVAHGDVVVFNFPEGDTVLLENQGVSYYEALRDSVRKYGRTEGRRRLYRYTVITRPVDKRENYIKRCIALPGDSLKIVDGEVYIDGALQPAPSEREFSYRVESAINLHGVLRNLGVTDVGYEAPYYYLQMTDHAAADLARVAGVVSVERQRPAPETFPQEIRKEWDLDNYGPLWIPEKGATVELTLENLPLYRRIIETYEGHTLEVSGDQISIDGAVASTYTFAMDYYWMMGDNRHYSLDSRFWGFVPEDHVVGKASFVWLSLDPEKSFPGNIRWSRMFRKVN